MSIMQTKPVPVVVPKVPVDPAKVRVLLVAREMKQSTLAERAKIDKTTLSRQLAEQRPMYLDELIRVADVLGVPWRLLLLHECDACHQSYSPVTAGEICDGERHAPAMEPAA